MSLMSESSIDILNSAFGDVVTACIDYLKRNLDSEFLYSENEIQNKLEGYLTSNSNRIEDINSLSSGGSNKKIDYVPIVISTIIGSVKEKLTKKEHKAINENFYTTKKD